MRLAALDVAEVLRHLDPHSGPELEQLFPAVLGVEDAVALRSVADHRVRTKPARTPEIHSLCGLALLLHLARSVHRVRLGIALDVEHAPRNSDVQGFASEHR